MSIAFGVVYFTKWCSKSQISSFNGYIHPSNITNWVFALLLLVITQLHLPSKLLGPCPWYFWQVLAVLRVPSLLVGDSGSDLKCTWGNHLLLFLMLKTVIKIIMSIHCHYYDHDYEDDHDDADGWMIIVTMYIHVT